MAAALVDALGDKIKKKLEVLRTLSGKELVGLRYVPPFDYYRAENDSIGLLTDGSKQHKQWRVVLTYSHGDPARSLPV